ncbi:uncharacterized protein PAF06_005388 [Gastrophryne carolinensis]
MAAAWSERVMQLLLRMNTLQRAECWPFLVQGRRVGWVLPPVAELLTCHPHVFTLKRGADPRLELSDRLHCALERSRAVHSVMENLRLHPALPCLQEWRNELYEVKGLFSDAPLFSMERAATPLLGIPRYGVHLNGFLRRDGRIFMWVAKRSRTKPTYPGKLDHLAAGGIAAGCGVWETLLKECKEEACIPECIASAAKPAGTISYAYREGGGLYLECQFVFDLEVPESFQPRVGDGEVEEFYLWPLDKVREAIATDDFKPNCALVVLDFLLRNGHITPDSEKYYTRFIEKLHAPL